MDAFGEILCGLIRFGFWALVIGLPLLFILGIVVGVWLF